MQETMTNQELANLDLSNGHPDLRCPLKLSQVVVLRNWVRLDFWKKFKRTHLKRLLTSLLLTSFFRLSDEPVKSEVAALQQKRTLAFVNHFVATTVQFLNGFTKTCELKLMHFERKLEKVEAAMVLLESRLSSIPEVNTITLPPQNQTPSQEAKPTGSSTTTEQKQQTDEENDAKTVEVPDEPPSVPPEYARFVKMVQVGVPVEAAKLKASLEGLDPDILARALGSK